ncbi:MAG TPA: nuclear transport factor 2 family protein [Candidatus Binataceae bacterium]|nr:nuclear transport factor 2 family protein [Candidatus Binataceae bacterium]
MNSDERKAAAIRFFENLNHPDPAVFEDLIAEDFKFEIVSGLTEFPPIHGRRNFAATECATLKRLFPSGLKLKIERVICDGPHVAVLAEADTVAANGRKYHQRYNFYLRFEGDQIVEGREYNDTNLVREVFLS